MDRLRLRVSDVTKFQRYKQLLPVRLMEYLYCHPDHPQDCRIRYVGQQFFFVHETKAQQVDKRWLKRQIQELTRSFFDILEEEKATPDDLDEKERMRIAKAMQSILDALHPEQFIAEQTLNDKNELVSELIEADTYWEDQVAVFASLLGAYDHRLHDAWQRYGYKPLKRKREQTSDSLVAPVFATESLS